MSLVVCCTTTNSIYITQTALSLALPSNLCLATILHSFSQSEHVSLPPPPAAVCNVRHCNHHLLKTALT